MAVFKRFLGINFLTEMVGERLAQLSQALQNPRRRMNSV